MVTKNAVLGGKRGELSASTVANLKMLLSTLAEKPLTHVEAADLINMTLGGIRPYMRTLKSSGLVKVQLIPPRILRGGKIEQFTLVGNEKKVQHFLNNLKLFRAFERTPRTKKAAPEPIPGRHFHYASDDEFVHNVRPHVKPAWRDPLVAAFFGPAKEAA